MGHVRTAYLHLLSTEPSGLPVATAALAEARTLPADDRERRHIQVIGALVQVRWRKAGAVLEDLTIDYPCDAGRPITADAARGS